MPEAYIVEAVRTPVTRRGTALAEVHPADLGAHVLNALVAQPCGVERCVQAVGSNRRSRVHAPDTIDQRRGEPCRRMHRKIKRNQTGGGDPLVC